MLPSSLLNNHGQSLVQVLVSIGIMGILMAAMTTMQQTQHRENRALEEKINSLDLQRSMTASLTSGNVCTYMLTHPQVTFNSTVITPTTPVTVTLSTPFYASVTAGVPGAILAQVGPAQPPNALPISRLTLTVNSGAGSNFIGSLDVNFDQSKLVRSLRAASAGVNLSVDNSTPTAAKVTSCAGTGASGSGAVTTAEDGNVALSPGSGQKLTTPYVNLNHGIFFVDFYDCIVGPFYGGADSVSSDYFLSASAEASSGSIATGTWNFRFSHNDIYNGQGFILKVLSPTANVRFFVQHGNGGSFSYNSTLCSAFYYTKISN